jgi:hypothetical protein
MNDGIHFHGTVSAGTFNNAAGDINISHGNQQINHGLDPVQVANLIHALRAELDATSLPSLTKDAVHDQLDEVDREMAAGVGSRSIAEKIRRVKETVAQAGGLVGAGGGLWTALKALGLAVGL